MAVFVGHDRHDLVDQIWRQWELCQQRWASQMVVLEGQPGVGKTRIVQEFFARLSAVQPQPRFWPSRMESGTDSLMFRREQIVPESFVIDADAKPSFAWVGIACQLDGLLGDPARALVPAVEASLALNEPIVVKHGRRVRVGAYVASIGVLVVGAIAAVLAALQFGGPMVAAVAAVLAVLGLLGLNEPLKRLWAERRKLELEHAGRTIDYSRPLRQASEDAKTKATAFLDDLAKDGIPAVVVVDNAHWADTDTVAFIDALLFRAAPVLIVATVRPDPFEKQFAERTAFGRVARDFVSKTRRLHVEPLADQAAAEIIRARAPNTDDAVVNAMTRRASGNPFVLEALLETPVISAALKDDAYRITDPTSVLAQLPTDYQGVFERYWDQLPRDLQHLLAVASLQGVLIQPDCAGSGYQALFGADPPAQLLIEQARVTHSWLARLDEFLDKFAEPALWDVTSTHGRPRVVTAEQVRQARAQMVGYLIERRAASESWYRMSPSARRVLSRVHVLAAQDGVVPSDEGAAQSAVDLAELTDAPSEGKAAAEYAQAALGWTRNPELIDRARGIAGLALMRAGQAAAAETVFSQQLMYRESNYGRDRLDTLQTRAYLALALRESGRPKEAIPRYEVLLVDLMRVLGPDHSMTLETRHNLAAALRQSGRLRDAVERYEALLTDTTRVLGPDDLQTLKTRTNLTLAISELDPTKATTQYAQLLKDQTRVLGADHPETLRSRANQAVAVSQSGQMPEAIQLYKALVNDETRVLGADHPITLGTRANMAADLADSGQLKDATEPYEALLTDATNALGIDHPVTLGIRANLAEAERKSGRYNEAIKRNEALITDQQRVLGADHPDTLETRANLALALQGSGRPSEAAKQFEALLDDMERVLGPDHPLIVDTQANLAMAQQRAGPGQ